MKPLGTRRAGDPSAVGHHSEGNFPLLREKRKRASTLLREGRRKGEEGVLREEKRRRKDVVLRQGYSKRTWTFCFSPPGEKRREADVVPAGKEEGKKKGHGTRSMMST